MVTGRPMPAAAAALRRPCPPAGRLRRPRGARRTRRRRAEEGRALRRAWARARHAGRASGQGCADHQGRVEGLLRHGQGGDRSAGAGRAAGQGEDHLGQKGGPPAHGQDGNQRRPSAERRRLPRRRLRREGRLRRRERHAAAWRRRLEHAAAQRRLPHPDARRLGEDADARLDGWLDDADARRLAHADAQLGLGPAGAEHAAAPPLDAVLLLSIWRRRRRPAGRV
mmetsp:Transcript_7117/g.20316  ORF Transcript_7117/g.20316 Transcript_7117/m.20316 type:complete len:225 (-) Transcript_7117:786-1460(-)